MIFSVTILGSNSAIPAYGRYPTAQYLNINDTCYLIDCGEAAQMRIEQLGLKKSRIDYIFISHLHGDHYFGLIGLLTSYQLLQRNRPLTIFCPPGLQEIIELQLGDAKGQLNFKLEFITTSNDTSYCLLANEDIEVYTIPLHHRIHCTGFLFRELKRNRKMIKEKIEQYHIPISAIPSIKIGNDFITPQGDVIPNEWITIPAKKPRSYAYCSDTAFNLNIVPLIREVDLLYHEATFLQENIDRAELTLHSTALQAATIAQEAHVQSLIIGHFSAKYANLEPLLLEAKSIFPNTELAIEGRTFEILH